MKYKINDIVQAKITGIEPYGAFILLDDGTKGLLHISEISNDFVSDISDYVENDSFITVKIIDIVDTMKVRVSLKALKKSNERRRRILKENPATKFELGFRSLSKQLKIWTKELEDENESKI